MKSFSDDMMRTQSFSIETVLAVTGIDSDFIDEAIKYETI